MFFKKVQFFTLLYFSASIVHGSQDKEHDAILKQILRAHRQYQQMIAQNPIPEDKKLTPEDADIYQKIRFRSHQSNLKDATELLLNPKNHWLVDVIPEKAINSTALGIVATEYLNATRAVSFSQEMPKMKNYATILLAAGATPNKKGSFAPRKTCPQLIAECERKIETLKEELKQDEINEKLAVAALLTQANRNCVLAIVFSQLLDHKY
jgi:hypothetical protein